MSHFLHAEGHCCRLEELHADKERDTEHKGPQGGERGPPQWDHHWCKTVGKQNTTLLRSHTHT